MLRISVFSLFLFYSYASLASDPGYNSVLYKAKKSMNYAEERQKVLSNNISRANIPGEKTMDLAAINSSGKPFIQMAVTNKKHILPKRANQKFNIIKPQGLETTLNGNNIDLTDQMSLMSENSNNAALANKVYQSISGLLKSAVGDK